MTQALCFNCGSIKFGALTPCDDCSFGSTGDWAIDIAMSDHKLSVDTLKAFGSVVKELQVVCSVNHLRLLTFLYYIAENHPDILGVNPTDEQRDSIVAVLAQVDLPTITAEPSMRALLEKEEGAKAREKASKKWWQIWK